MQLRDWCIREPWCAKELPKILGRGAHRQKLIIFDGEPGGARTRDHRIKSAMLYQLSYRPDREGNGRIDLLL